MLLRRLAGAFVVGTVLVLAIDSLLHIALGAIRDDATSAPWWVNARVVERSVWVVAAVMAWWLAPWFAASMPATNTVPAAGDEPRSITRQAARRIVGAAMIVVPVLWFFATLIAFAVSLTLRGDWAVDGQRLLAPYVYSEAVLANAPWLLAGATLIVLARHLASD